jgi:hypothetical protein
MGVCTRRPKRLVVTPPIKGGQLVEYVFINRKRNSGLGYSN